MCKKRVGGSFLQSSPGSSTDRLPEMENSAAASPLPGSASADDLRRVKFLCSFGGSILPRPSDGKLRYVGGETRIVSLPRDFTYEDLMARMRELFEGAWALKYQQPDEDLDALVSVVNDDDVINMMEEYDKLGVSGDGFTRLRVFLFSHPDSEGSSPHYDTDERETERRYVDALNSLSDGIPQQPDSSLPPAECSRARLSAEQFFDPHHLTIPHLHPHGQRYNEMDGQWSPAAAAAAAYYSPGHHTPHDLREFPPSPSAGRYHVVLGDLNDRVSEEYKIPIAHQTLPYEHHSPFLDNVVWLPPPGGMVGEKAGFPVNLGHTHNIFPGNGTCEHCGMAFQRTQSTVTEASYYDNRWKQGQSHMEQSNAGSEFTPQFSGSCAECFHSREAYFLNQEKPDLCVYPKEQGEQHSYFNELHAHERGWSVRHHPEELRGHHNERVVLDGNGMNFHVTHGNFYGGHPVPPNGINHDDPRYARPFTESGSQAYHDSKIVAPGPHMHFPGLEDNGIRHGSNPPAASGADCLYPAQHGSASMHVLRRKVQVPVHPGPLYDSSGFTGFIRSTQDGSPRFSCAGMDDQIQNPWAGHSGSASQKVYPIDGCAALDYNHTPKLNANIIVRENQRSYTPESDHCITAESSPLAPLSPGLVVDNAVASLSVHHPSLKAGTDLTTITRLMEESNLHAEAYETKKSENVKGADIYSSPSLTKKYDIRLDSNGCRQIEEDKTSKLGDPDTSGLHEHGEVSAACLSFLPELIASAKKVALESADEVKVMAHANDEIDPSFDPSKRVEATHKLEDVNDPKEVEADSDSEQLTVSKIEPTTAEAEAFASGLQTIMNADLEQIRELGSGTYGSVFHGKWKGSDVAVKRIKASCFTGKPSERERLIADFWKEALILSSLHHPNVVSFYGVVRDCPDGSLATVTEFMVNGSLKQFLQKKDRTIDRRKRLIIAMDAAFGMEYLHGKNIVHFDLKCENLLVNMRDPHRPVCKIGDLGLSKVRQQTLVSGGVRGTLPWMAPELLSGKSNMVTEKIDVYSFGIVMWELLTGEEPYADMRCASVIGGIVNNTLRPQIPTWCDPEWKSLMESCWSSDPGLRPSFSEISQKLRQMAAAINVK